MSLSYSHDHLGSVWYHSEPSEGPHSPNQYITGQELFLAVSYSKPALDADFQAIHVSKIRLIQGLAYFYFQVTKCTFNNYGPSGTVENKDGLCVLAINIINEKIYIFLWFWFLTLCVWTGVHLFIRILSMALVNFR